MKELFDFAVTTIFARELFEGAIIIGEYRTIIFQPGTLAPGVSRDKALKEVNVAALVAVAFAFFVLACVAIPLAVLSHKLNTKTTSIIEGVSKMVAAISLLQLSLKIPKMLNIYGPVPKNKQISISRFCSTNTTTNTNNPSTNTKKRSKRRNDDRIINSTTIINSISTGQDGVTLPPSTNIVTTTSPSPIANNDGLTVRSIRFNVAWNIWREVAECGVFLIPFFLSGENVQSIPLSALIGIVVGLVCGYGLYRANQTLHDKRNLCIFSVLLLVVLSAGLFTGGVHEFEEEYGSTTIVWTLSGNFWDVNKLPMTVLKPFGYSSTRTVLMICCYWAWLLLSALLHYRKYSISPKISPSIGTDTEDDINNNCPPLNDNDTSSPSNRIHSTTSTINTGNNIDKDIELQDNDDETNTVEYGESSYGGSRERGQDDDGILLQQQLGHEVTNTNTME